MSKRKWPDHPGIGKSITFNGQEVEVVDVKSGPMLIDTSTFDQPRAKISGTLCLCVKYPDGSETWTPPLDGGAFLKFCGKEPQS